MTTDPNEIITTAILIGVFACVVTAGIIIPLGFVWFRWRANKIMTEKLR
jgi:hypothetical protein